MASLLLPMTLPTLSALFHLLEAVNSLLKVRAPQAIRGAQKAVDSCSHPKNSKAHTREATLSFLNLAPLFRLSESESACQCGNDWRDHFDLTILAFCRLMVTGSRDFELYQIKKQLDHRCR